MQQRPIEPWEQDLRDDLRTDAMDHDDALADALAHALALGLLVLVAVGLWWWVWG